MPIESRFTGRHLLACILIRCLLPFYMMKYRGFWSLRQAALNVNGGVLHRIYDAYCSTFGASIPLSATIKAEPVFPHGLFGIFVSKGAVIGTGAVIFQQVTIGSNTLKDHGGEAGLAPIIGDNVYIGAGAKIIGGVNVGDNCRIGANACVYESIPAHSVAVNSPTRVIQKSNLINKFYPKV